VLDYFAVGQIEKKNFVTRAIDACEVNYLLNYHFNFVYKCDDFFPVSPECVRPVVIIKMFSRKRIEKMLENKTSVDVYHEATAANSRLIRIT